MTSKDIHLSKSLSWLLRHGAVKEGLTLSPEGYINVDKVLQHKLFTQYSLSDIQRVVQNNDKQRFTLRVDPVSQAVEIKANQGHSIEKITEAELTPILTAKYKTVVHGSYTKCWPQIKESGLSRMKRNHIHLAKGTTTDRTVISGLRTNAQIHIYINLEQALEDGIKFYESDNGVILTPGNDKGFLETKYFDRVVKVLTGWGHAVPVKAAMEAVPLAGGPQVRAAPRYEPRVILRAPRPQLRGPEMCFPGRAPASAPPLPPVSAAAPARSAGAAGAARSAGAAGAAHDARSRPQPQPQPDRPLPTSVLVTGYPPYTKAQDLAHVFCRFGDVRLNYDWITDTGACLEFGTVEQARAAIAASRQVNIYGAFLTVRPCTLLTRPQKQPRRREQRVKQTSKGVTVEPSSIPLEGPFQQQLEALLLRVQLSQQQLARLALLYADIEGALHDTWPGCRAYPFGSVTTGLGVKSSDADCFVALPPGASAQAVPRARRALQQHPRIFSELVAIPRANTPIVKFLHLPTGVYCDLSFKTSLGSRNSKLISFLLYSDPRLIPMAVVIKYWARVHELTGTGKLTNYALTMLIIFYLQQPPRSILPSVEWLQRDPSTTHYVDYWNTGFLDDHGKLPRSPDKSSVAELLGGFFDFYSKFDFDKFAVCPFTGRQIKKDDFRDLELLPQEFGLYKLNVSGGYSMPMRFMTPMCVQDPFEQCHNVASPVTPRLAQDICAFFKFAAAGYERERPTCNGFLQSILLHKPELPRVNTKCRFRVRMPPGVLQHVAVPDWRKAVREVTFKIFESLLRIKLDVPEEERRQANAKGNNAKEVGTADAKPKGVAAEGKGPTVGTVKAKGKEATDMEGNETIKPGKVSVNPKEKDVTNEEKVTTKTGDTATAKPEDKVTTKPEDKKTSRKKTKPEGTTTKPEDKVTVKPEEKTSPKKTKPEETTTKPEDKVTTNPEEKKTSPKKTKLEGTTAKTEGKAKPAAGVAAKEKERYTARVTRAVWKRKRFLNRDGLSLRFPEREQFVTDDILRLDPVELKIGFQIMVTYLDGPRAAFLDVKYISGEVDCFKEFGYFINTTFNNWFVLLINPYCKDGFDRRALPDMTAINYKDECTDTDSDTDSYEDERINPNAKSESKQGIEKLTESHNDYNKLLSVIEKIHKNNTNDAVKEQSESDKNKTQPDKSKPDNKNDKDGNPSDKSPQKKNKNRSPRHKKGKDSTQSSPAHTNSQKTTSIIANGQLP